MKKATLLTTASCLILALNASALSMVDSPALGTQTTVSITYPSVGTGSISLLINTAAGSLRDSCYVTLDNTWLGYRIGLYDTTSNILANWQSGAPGWQSVLASNQCSIDLANSTRTDNGYTQRIDIRITKGIRLTAGNAQVVATYWYQSCSTYCNNEMAYETVGFWNTNGTAGGARLTSPAAGSVLEATSATFSFFRPPDAGSVCIRVGPSSTPSANPQQCPAGSSAVFSNLPNAGQPVYVTLESSTNGDTIANTFTLYAVEQNRPAVLVSPANLAPVAPGSTVNLTWGNALNATGYSVLVGSSLNDSNVLSASLPGTANSARFIVPNVVGYLNIALVTKFSNGEVVKRYSLTVPGSSGPSPQALAVLSPAEGTRLDQQSVTFTWTALAGAASQYYLFIGSSPGRADVYPGATRPEFFSGNSKTVDLRNALDGRPLWVTIVGRGNPADKLTDVTAKYTTAVLHLPPPPAADPSAGIGITEPAPGVPISSEIWFWTARGTSFTDWTFSLGSTLNGNDLYSGYGRELDSTRIPGVAKIDTIPGFVTNAYATLSVKIGSSWYSSTSMNPVIPASPTAETLAGFKTCITSASQPTTCILPAGIYSIDTLASGDTGPYEITRSGITITGADEHLSAGPNGLPKSRTILWRKSGCQPLLTIGAGVQNVTIQNITLDGNNETLANTCLGSGLQPTANDMYIHGRNGGGVNDGTPTNNITLRRMIFRDAVGRGLTVAGAKIGGAGTEAIKIDQCYFKNAAGVGALVWGNGYSDLIAPAPTSPLDPSIPLIRKYVCDTVTSMDSDIARSVPQYVLFTNSSFKDSWTGAVALNSVFYPQISGSIFGHNYFNPYDGAGGTIFVDRCAALATVSNSIFDGTGLDTATEGLEVHGARATITGNTIRGFPSAGIVLHSSWATTVLNNQILNNGSQGWTGNAGIIVVNREYAPPNGRVSSKITLEGNTIGNAPPDIPTQRYGIRFDACPPPAENVVCGLNTFSVPGVDGAIKVLNNTFLGNTAGPYCEHQVVTLNNINPSPDPLIALPKCQ